MSFYRFARATAVLALLRRYRMALLRIVFAIAFALVTAWVYPDIAHFIEAHHPNWAGLALAIKTLIIYAALFVCCWQLVGVVREAEPASERQQSESRPKAASPPAPPSEGLEALRDKPELRSRKDEILRN